MKCLSVESPAPLLQATVSFFQLLSFYPAFHFITARFSVYPVFLFRDEHEFYSKV